MYQSEVLTEVLHTLLAKVAETSEEKGRVEQRLANEQTKLY